MHGEPRDEEAIFHIARGIPDSELRSRYLDQACSGDKALRDRVEALLAVDEQEQDFLKSAQPEGAPTLEHRTISEAAGQVIGRYKLLQKIGEGGFGVVYMAEQTKPIRRNVALKIIKPGMDSKEVIARFEAERQALAMMDHPNIAKVLDGGTTDSGHPYFVMELVKGVPITEYCDDNHLRPDERLRLFAQVCDAVQHAHHKGIIHRDLKPSNVLVAEYDHQAVPKIIDFGVAKALDQSLTEKTLFTEFGQIIGTVEYMSPEQAKFNQLDIDTRSDVYSLGVLLYELLSGETPFDRVRLRQVALDELVKIIREEEPPKPSTRFLSSKTIPTIANARKITVPKLERLLKGELDNIVMKSLEKDRARRYVSPRDLADDVRRFLNHQPVQATPPSTLYRLKKVYRQHRGFVNALAAVFSAVAIGAVLSATGWYNASNSNRALRAALDGRAVAIDELNRTLVERDQLLGDLEDQTQDARDNATAAAEQAETAQAVTRFLVDDVFGSVSPSPEYPAQGDVRVKTIIDSAAKRLADRGNEVHRKPELEIQIRLALGKAYLSLGHLSEAQLEIRAASSLAEVSDIPPRMTSRIDFELGWLHYYKRDYAGSAEYFREAYENAPSETIAERRFRLRARMRYAAQLTNSGRKHRLASEILKECIRSAGDVMEESDPFLGVATKYLALSMGRLGEKQKREEMGRRAWQILQDAVGPDHPETLIAKDNYAHWLRPSKEKMRILEELYHQWASVAPPAFSLRIKTTISYTKLLAESGGALEALKILLETRRVLEEISGCDPHLLAIINFNIGVYQTEDSKHELAKANFERAERLFAEAGVQISVVASVLAQAEALHAMKKMRESWDLLHAQKSSLIANMSKGNGDFPVINYFATNVTRIEPEIAVDFVTELWELLDSDEQREKSLILVVHLADALKRLGRLEESQVWLEQAKTLCDADDKSVSQSHAAVLVAHAEHLLNQNSSPTASYETIGILCHCFTTDFSGPIKRAHALLEALCWRDPKYKRQLMDLCEEALKDDRREEHQLANHVLAILCTVGDTSDAVEIGQRLAEVQNRTAGTQPAYRAWTATCLAKCAIAEGDNESATEEIEFLRKIVSENWIEGQAAYYWPLELEFKQLISSESWDACEAKAVNLLKGMCRIDDWQQKVDYALEIIDYGLEYPYRVEHLCGTLIDACDGMSQSEGNSSSKLEMLAWCSLIAFRLEEFSKSEEFLRKRLRLEAELGASEGYGDFEGHLAEALIYQGNGEEALQIVESLEEKQNSQFYPGQRRYYWPARLRALVLILNGDFKQAEETLIPALQKSLTCGGFGRFDQLARADDIGVAIQLYQRWMESSPSNSEELQSKHADWRTRLEKDYKHLKKYAIELPDIVETTTSLSN